MGTSEDRKKNPQKSASEESAQGAAQDRDKNGEASVDPSAGARERQEGPPAQEKEQAPGSVKERITELAERGEHLLKTALERVEHLAEELSETARLKLALRTLEGEMNHNYRELGDQVWNELRQGKQPPFGSPKVKGLLSLLNELAEQKEQLQRALEHEEENPPSR